jgi:linoleoyl-CoA desaturase
MWENSATRENVATLRKRVDSYFKENKISKHYNTTMVVKTVVFLSAYILPFVAILIFNPSFSIALALWAVMGFSLSGIGMSIMHDANHGSYSTNPKLNDFLGLSLNAMGASSYFWKQKHNIIHHTYTNVDGVDDDIEVGVFMRMAPTQKHYVLHRFQHLYFSILYMLLYVFWIFFTDYNKYFKGKIGSIPLKKMSIADHFEFWIVKVYHAAIFVVVPIVMLGWQAWLVGFIVSTFFAGFILSIVFQLAHTVEHTEFPIANQPENRMPDEFAAHQIQTTANFATKSKIISWLVGGLNFQIEHHLFPKISHVHYPAISKIVKEACAEFKLNYIEYPTVLEAVKAHVQFLKSMGNPSPSVA